MPTRRVTPIRFWNGTAWSDGMVPVYNDKGTNKMTRIWYSNDSVTWAPTDLADVVAAPPSVPNSFDRTIISSTQINLNWAAPSTPADMIGYRLTGQAGAVPELETGTVLLNGANQTSYAHTGLTGSTYYGYRLAGMTADGQYGPSATAGGTTNPAYTDYYAEFGIVGVGAWTGAAWEAQSYAGRVRQGNSSGSSYTGFWFYGQGLKDNINGATILNSDFRFSRQTASGPTGAVTVQVGLHPFTTKPGSGTGFYGAAPATNTISRLEFKWWHGGGGGATATSWAQHIASDVGGAWRGLQCGGYGIDINYTYVSYGANKDAADNDPAGQWRIWWRRYG